MIRMQSKGMTGRTAILQMFINDYKCLGTDDAGFAGFWIF